MAKKRYDFEVLEDYFRSKGLFIDNEIRIGLSIAMDGDMDLLPAIFEIARHHIDFGEGQDVNKNHDFVARVANDRQELANALGSTISRFDNTHHSYIPAVIFARKEPISVNAGEKIYKMHHDSEPKRLDELVSPYCYIGMTSIHLLHGVNELLKLDEVSSNPGLQVSPEFVDEAKKM